MTVGVHAAAPTGGNSGISITTPSRTSQASGSTFILIGACFGDTFGGTPVQDSKSNTWTQVGTSLSLPTATGEIRVYKAVNATGGAGHTFTLNPGAAAFPALFMVEVPDALASPTITFDRQLDTSTPYTSPGISPATATTLIGGLFSDAPSGTETDTWGGSFSSGDKIEALTDANSTVTGSMAANVQASAGTFSASVTISGVTVTDAGVLIVAVQTSTGGGGATVQSTEAPNRPRPGRGPFSRGRFYVSDTTAYTSSANITAGLTGTSATFASGSMVPSASKALTGQAASGASGTVVSGIAKGLTGTSAAGAAGALVAGLSASLAGQSLAAASGALSSGTSHALTGQNATVTAGTVTTGGDVTASLTGQSVATTAGTVFAASQIVVSGQSSATSAGTMVYSASVALLGQPGAFAAGTFAQSHAVGFTGQSSTFTSGVVSPPGGVTLSLVGQVASFTTGSVNVSSATVLTGQAATSSSGSLIAGHTSALSGSSLTSSSGILLGSFALALTGQSTSLGAGIVAPPSDKSAALSGQLATFRSGVIVPIGAVLVGNPHYIVQRPRKRDFTVSACTFRNFPPKDPAESIPLTFDFEVDLAPGITLAGTPVVTVTVNSGSDPAPVGILNGLPRFDITSTEVIVPVLGGITNCDYDIKVVVNTTDSLTILALSGVLPVRA